MKNLAINEIKVGNLIGIQEPSQHFSSDSYIVREIGTVNFKLEICAGGEDDGKIVDFPLDLLKNCEIWEEIEDFNENLEYAPDPFNGGKMTPISLG